MAFKRWGSWKHNDKGKRLCPLCGKPTMSRAWKSNSETEKGERLYGVQCHSCDHVLYETRHRDLSVHQVYYFEGE